MNYHNLTYEEIAYGAFCIYEEEKRLGRNRGQVAHWLSAIERLIAISTVPRAGPVRRTEAETVTQNMSRRVVVLPYLRLSSGRHGVREVRVGPAEFWPDDEKTWKEVVKAPRPPWLDIYREFPLSEGEEAPPALGTILLSENDDWLMEPGHVDNAVAVLFALGQPEDQWQTPAEAFFYIDFQAKGSYSDLVSIPTKTHLHLETAESLRLMPPLELRGPGRFYRVPVNSPENSELLRRFAENPDDRLVVGCYHLFRAQFANRFSLPLRQDYAAYCASLEALFEIDGTQHEIAQTMIRNLQAIYPEVPGLDRWVKGLYCERSVFNHGASDKVRPPGWEDWFKARDEFRARGAGNNLALLKRVCLEVLHDSLREAAKLRELSLARLMSRSQSLVRGFFTSDAMWAELNAHFAQDKAGMAILAYAGEQLDDFIEKCAGFLSNHRWRYSAELPARARLINALQTCAIVIVNHPESDEDDKAGAKSLGEATDAENDDISDWSAVHRHWEESQSSADSCLANVKAVAAHIASLFETRAYVDQLK